MNELSLLSGFISGLLASTHCILMCGGISILVAQERFGIWPHILRICVYALLAMAASLIFQPGVWIPPWFLGVGLIGAGILSYFSRAKSCATCPSKKQPSFSSVLGTKSAPLTKGLVWLWGFLPCPMVIMMVATSLSLGSPLHIGAFMLSFGLGTLPALLCLSYGAHWFISRLKLQKTWLEIGLIGLGTWSLLFGLLFSHDNHNHSSHHHHASINYESTPVLRS